MQAKETLDLERGVAGWLTLYSKTRSWKGTLGFWYIQGVIISREAKLFSMTSAVPSLGILLYPGELMAFHDVTSVVATPTALRALLQ